jgi:hypothetical protein
MADEVDAGIDKQRILAEIGASAPLPGEPPPPAAPPRDYPSIPLSALAPPTLPAPPAAPPAPLPQRMRQPRLVRHRRQLAAFVLVFVALLWFGVAIATQERIPFAFGGGFLGLAILVGAGSLLREA